MKNKKIYLIALFSIFFLVISTVIYLKMLHKTKDELIAEKYTQNAKILQNRIQDMIISKQKATMALAITLAHADKDLPLYIKNKQIPFNYYNPLLAKYKKDTLYKNIWIQILDKKGTSLYRSWCKNKGDALAPYRKDVESMLLSLQNKSSISVGKHDLNIKSMVPIFEDKKIIGIIEVISHFNSIAKRLQKSGIESIVLADKKYKKQLKHPFTNFFINNYYVANKNAKPEFMQYLKRNGIKNYLQNGFKIENGYFIVSYALKNDNKTIGTYITFQKVDDLSLKSINDFVIRWMLFGILGLMCVIGIINIVMYSILRKQKKYYQNIVDSSTNIVLVRNSKHILEANKIFFNFFKEYQTLDAFKAEHNCICDFFIKSEGYISREMEGINWVEYIKIHPEKPNKIKMSLDDKIYYFLVSASEISKDPARDVIILSDITTEEIYKEELEKLTITDTLTQIKNRRYYELTIAKEVERACRYKKPLSIVMLDIDFFKKVNDEHGHDVGDKVLVEYTRLIKSMLRNTDEFCRVGGEEFIIIATDTSEIDAYTMTEKIRKAVETHHIVLPITMSFGVVQYKNCEDKDSLFKRVDNALYKAKNSGRNRVVIG